jgi:2-oxoglutarate dehydrogenase E1 component
MARGGSNDTFLYGSNALFLEHLYSQYIQNPASLDPEWSAFFSTLGDEAHQILKQAVGASWAPRIHSQSSSAPQSPPAPSGDGLSQETLLNALRAQLLIRVYRVRGHLNATLDPLGLSFNTPHPELDPQSYGFTAQDTQKKIFLNGTLGLDSAPLETLVSRLRSIYCGPVGMEFMHMQDPEQKEWLQERFERGIPAYGTEDKRRILKTLIRSEDFEQFLSVKFPGAKRFGLEGGESFITAMEALITRSAAHGVQDVVLGMAHRGRLNVLTNILGMPPRKILAEFQSNPSLAQGMQGSGDVKYHLGASSLRQFGDHKVLVSLTANPSHLEAVNPVVVGKVRAKQKRSKDLLREHVLGILIHGDAAFAGQGLVAETLGLSELSGYKTGGTIHVVINNQIGFTTSPHLSRSSPYCSDAAKVIQAPVFHVNGDHPEAVTWVAQLAADFQATFKKDVVIDLYCYRRHGHNEMDEPSFTQPLMYQKIRSHPSTRALYNQKLVQEGSLSQTDHDRETQAFHLSLQEEFEASKSYKSQKTDWHENAGAGITPTLDKTTQTGISSDQFDIIANALTRLPQGFDCHKRLGRVLEEKAKALSTGEGIDWATGEALAFGSLLLEGYPVRLSGQDCGRGTFSQRHAIIYDQTTGAPYIPLNGVSDAQSEIEIVDSPLSEASVLGFEYGYSLADPDSLILWEAQFGDFANGAQVIIDQFLAGGEVKWGHQSNVTLLLPHGYEGQGPEHSSARFERYLQLCAEDNLQVANCTSPANYFHLLRRQLHRPDRKPCILMTPKSFLRHKRAVSTKAEFLTKTSFQPVLKDIDSSLDRQSLKRIVFCTGKVYYDLLEAREEHQQKQVALVRLEQLYPFPEEAVVAVLAQTPKAEVVWCQEEPENMGPWHFLDRRLEKAMTRAKMVQPRPLYIGRPEAASTATGFAIRHKAEQDHLITSALMLNSTKKGS